MGILLELAERLGVRVSEIKCELAHLTWPAAPDGLCAFCWRDGKRVGGRSFLRSDTRVDGSPMVTTIGLCADHRRDVVSSVQLTEAP